MIPVFVLGVSPAPLSAQQSPCARTYTSDADFDEGTLLNVNHDPDHDQLQLNPVTQPFPFVYIANSARGTAVRIDVNSGQVLGEYLTAPEGRPRNPSRTTVDKLGNVWVANRDESQDGKGSVVRIGLILGGTRGHKLPAGFVPDPGGQYLQAPFLYNTCVDRDGDDLIKTSRALADVLAWPNPGGVDSNGGVSSAEDECVINYTRVAGSNTRTVAVDANNDVWVGGADRDHEKLDGVTGNPVAGTQVNFGCGGYGGLIDGNGVLWSARFGANLLRFDPAAPPGVCLDGSHGDYGLGIDPQTGHVWHSFLDSGHPNGRIAELASNGAVLNVFEQHGNQFAQGVAVDGVGNVWVAHSLIGPSTTVGHLRTDGTYVGNVPLPGGSGPTGVAVDANGKIWVANISSDNAMRIDPGAGPIGGGGFPVGAVDLVVDLGAGAGPYNYSDMTGFVAIGSTAPSGTWTVVRDGGTAGTAWGTVSWNGSEPEGTSIRVEVRAADSQAELSSKAFQEVADGVSFCDPEEPADAVAGRFLEIRTTLSRSTSVTVSPILYDLTVECCNNPPVAQCQDVTVPADGQCQAEASVDAGSFDPDGDPIDLAQSPTGPYPSGATSVLLTVTDDQGASDTCSALVTVVDQTPPTAVCPGPLAAAADASCQAAVPDLVPSVAVADNCAPSGALGVSQSPPAGTPVGPGAHPIVATVTDPAGNSSTCSTTFTVTDATGPSVSSSVASPSLWPPNHNLVNVGLAASATDNCTAAPGLAVLVFGDEDDEMPTGDGAHSPDAKDLAPGTLRLRSERRGDADGRVYLILSQAVDGAGNGGYSCATVAVPHSPSPAGQASVDAQAAAALAHCQATGTAPPGYFVVGDGPVIGPKQ